MRFVEEEYASCLTFFSLAGVTGSSGQNVSSTSMDLGVFSPCKASLFSALGCLLDFFLRFG